MLNSYFNPYRPPAWRWNRAKEIIAGGGLPTTVRRDGEAGFRIIRRLVRFLRDFAAGTGSPGARDRLSREHPLIYWAHNVHVNDPLGRARIEAFLLAGENDTDVARETACPIEVVAAYEQIFFDVREKLAYDGYVLGAVLPEEYHKGFSTSDYALLWKVVGWLFGPFMLKAVTRHTSISSGAGSLDETSSLAHDITTTSTKLLSALSMITMPVNSYTRNEILNHFMKLHEIERLAGTTNQPREQLLERINALMHSLDFVVGDDAKINGGSLKEYDDRGMELRFDQRLLLIAGKSMDEEVLGTAVFPQAVIVD